MLRTGQPAAALIARTPRWALLHVMTMKSTTFPSHAAASTSCGSTSIGTSGRSSSPTRTGSRRWYQTTIGG